MDPFSALSLAGNIIQFVDFGGRLLSKARELCKSPVGTLTVHDEITLITTDLEVLVTKLRLSTSSNLDIDENDDGVKVLRKLCDEAASVAEELLKRLGTLKLDSDGKNRRLGSLQVAVRSLWNEKEILGLSKRLATLKEALETRVLLSIRSVITCRHPEQEIIDCLPRETINLQSIRTSARFDSLDQQTQQVLSSILQCHNDIAGHVSREMMAITTTVSQILSRLCSRNQGSHDVQLCTRGNILEQMCERENHQYHKTQQITAGIEMLSVSDGVEQQVRKSVQMVILRRLGYVEMTSRYEDVDGAHPETFEWAFRAPPQEQS